MKLNLQQCLNSSEIEQIHRTSVRILSEIGITVHSDSVLDLLAQGGAQVDRQTRRALIPESLLNQCIETLPHTVKLCGRDGEIDFTLPSEQTITASGHNAIYVSDPDKKERRPSTKRDIADFARLSDALEHIDVVGVQAMPQDVNPKATLLHAVDAIWNNSTKHVFFSPEALGVTKAIIEMAKAVAGTQELSDKPIATCQLSSTSPLYWETGAVESVIVTAQSGLPLCLLPQPFSGVTSPISVAGTLAIHNTEVLSGIVISQLARKGAPIIYGSAWTTFNMKEGNVIIGSPEAALLRVAGAQLAEFYGIPSHTIGPDSDSHAHDEQNGWEKMLSTLAAVTSGVDLLVNAGMFATGLSVSFAQLVMDDEILGIARRYAQGVEVTEHSLAFDAIKEVGPGGDFLMTDHTLGYLRSAEHFEPAISCRSNYDNWQSRGAQDITMTAQARAMEILATHQVDPLGDNKQKQLTDIITRFESEQLKTRH